MGIEPVSIRLQNQQLVRPRFSQPDDIVSWLGAVQAQDFAGACWAIGLRCGASARDVDSAFSDGRVIRTHVLRPTWHFVSPADIRWMLALSAPRVTAASASQHRRFELDARTFSRSAAVLERALEGGKLLTRTEIQSALKRAGIEASGPRLAYLMMHAELHQIVCSGPRRGRQFTYALLSERVPPQEPLDADGALAELTKRYFDSHGPATARDFAWWSGLPVRDARTGVAMLGRQLERKSIDGLEYWFVPARWEAARRRPTAWLLPNYDEFLIAYRDRGLVLNATSSGSDPYQHHVILGGRLAGSWKPALAGRGVTVSMALYRRPSPAETRALFAAAERYEAFVGRPVALVTARQKHITAGRAVSWQNVPSVRRRR